MQLKPAVHLTARSRTSVSVWELGLRYAAATTATLLAIAGAQLVVPNSFIWMLIGVTLAGLPVSIYMRLNDMRLGSKVISRGLWNGLTALATFIATFVFIFHAIGQVLQELFNGGGTQEFWLHFGPEYSVSLLMQIFLLFAAFRSFALISDKDATLSTVPSFSVLLLLIPVHKGIEVVFYFLLWTVVAATLFALDHRSESRLTATAYVPAIFPGQDVRLAARSLATVLGVSLVAAAGISYLLTLRDAADRSQAEIAISELASRLTKYALSIPELSTNSGPERQIDFSSGLTLPTRTELWLVSARAIGGRSLQPAYWRLFTLNTYDGKSWGQGNEIATPLKRKLLTVKAWPPRQFFVRRDEFIWQPHIIAPMITPQGEPNLKYFDPRIYTPPGPPAEGFMLEDALPNVKHQLGNPRVLVRQDITALMPSVGFLPCLPSVRSLQVDTDRREIKVRSDGSLNVGVVRKNETMRAISEVPALPEYGFSKIIVPVRRLSAAQVAASPAQLTAEQRKRALQLPSDLPQRVRDLGRGMLRGSSASESNYRLAQRLALGIQDNSVYTLHPPAIPEGQDATDYFLFEGRRRGYCTYFAGALTVLCRTRGIPARVVSGFVNINDQREERSVFREANAHAWTEVWVDGWGWAVVDATPTDDRGDNSPTWIEVWQDWFSDRFMGLQLWVQPRLFPLSTVASLVIFLLVFRRSLTQMIGKSWFKSKPNQEWERRVVIDTYKRVAHRMTRKYRARSAWETPDEWLQNLGELLSPSDAESLRRLTALYSTALYGGQPLPNGSGALAQRTAETIVWKL